MGVICAACGGDNRQTARFCDGCGAALPARCSACGNELRPDARFCDGCGAAVGEPTGGADPAGGEARKSVTVVFADLAGSTGLQERMDAESVRRVMGRFYEAMRGAVTDHGGTVVKFMGDGIMAAFGVPTVAEDDAVRAVRAGAAMQDAFGTVAEEVRGEWNAHVGLRVGVNTGEVVVAEGEDDVVGDAVNVAARLEHAAGESEVLVGQETWRLTRHVFTFEPVAPLDLKGKADPVAGYRLVSLDASSPEEASPFVGRRGELKRLTTAFHTVLEQRRAHLVTVVGSPGLGKTRLVRELAQRLGDSAVVLEGQCEASGSTFAPVADVLRQAAGIDEAASPDDVVAALAGLLPDADEAGRVAASAATVLGVEGSVSPEEVFWAVRRVLERAAQTGPVVVVFDDVQWAEPMFLDLLEHLAEWMRDVPVLLVALARPEIRDARPTLVDAGATPSDVIVLDALTDDDGLRLASELLEGHPLESEVAARLIESAEGNPLFLRELVKMLLDDGVLHLHDDVWKAAEGVEIDVPPTIHALLSARIERLGSEERSVVERAAVVGQQFFRGAVATLSPPPVAVRLDAHLETLRRKEVVEPEGTYWIDEPVFRFHHALIRDAAYRRLLKESRAELHERVADWLARKAGDVVGEHEEVIGHHLEQAHGYRRDLGGADEATVDLGRRAAAHLAAASRRALDRDDLRSAASLTGRAVACLPPDDPSRAELLVDRCEALLGLGEVTEGAEVLADLEAASSGSARLAAWVEAFAAQRASLSEPEALPDWVVRAGAAADALDDLGDPVGTAKAAAVHASLLARLGQVGACEAALDRALAAAREAGDRRRANGVLAGAPLAALWGPSPVTRAAGRCLDVVRVLRITTDSPPVEAVALRAQGVLEAFRGRFDASRRLVSWSRRTLEELGHRHGILQSAVFAGLVELAADDPGAAEVPLREAHEGFRALGIGVDTAQAGALLARACLAQGRDDEALELTEESERLGGHDLKTAIAWRAVRAEVLARRDQHDEAVRLARQAVALAVETDALVDHADARLALATVLTASGDASAGAEEAQRAVDLYEAKDATALADRARRLLGLSDDTRRVEERPTSGTEGSLSAQAPPPAALGGRALGSRVAAVWHRYRELFPAGDVEGILGTVAPEYVVEERQHLAQHTITGRDGFRGLLTAIFESQFTHVDAKVVATRGPDLAMVRVTWHVRAPSGGDFEVDHLRVDEADETGLLTRSVAFDSDDLDAAFDQLDEWFAAHVDPSCRPIIEVSSANRRAYNARDWEAMRSRLTEDFVLFDHRPTGWGQLDADGYVETLRGFIPLAPDVATYSIDVVAIEPTRMFVGLVSRGTDAEGGCLEVAYDILGFAADGKFHRIEVFDPSQRSEVLALLTAPVPSAGVDVGAGNLAVRTWERGRQATVAGDLEGVLAVMADDVTYEERTRTSGLFAPLKGKAALEDLYTTVFSGDVTFPHVEVLATRGSRLALTKATLRWTDERGTTTEHDHLRLDQVDDAGAVVATILFEPDAVLEAIEEMNRRYRGHGDPSVSPALELSEVLTRAHAESDWQAYGSRLAPGFVLVDHRRMGWGEIDAEGFIDRNRTLKEMSPDQVLWPAHIERADGDVSMGLWMARGTGLEGGSFELVWRTVAVIREGLLERGEFFDADDDTAVTRFDELLAAARFDELGVDNLAVAAWERYVPLVERKDFDGILALQSPDYVLDQRIRSVLTVHRGRDEVREVLEAVFDAAHRVEFEVLATRGVRLALVRATEHIRGGDGGDAEIEWLQVDETDEAGLMVASVFFDTDDLDAAYDELDERYLAQVGSSCAPQFEIVKGIQRSYRTRDVGAFRAMLNDDYVLIDHRPAGWGTLGVDAQCAHVAGFFELAEGITVDFPELHIAPGWSFSRMVTRGTGIEGGAIEVVFYTVGKVVDGRGSHMEFFPVDERSAAWARFQELVTTDAPPERR